MSDRVWERAAGLGAVMLALGLVSFAVAPAARAQGISLGWQDCRAGGNPGFNAQSFGCLSTTTDLPLYPGVQLTAPVDSVFSMELVIDVDVAQDPLPEWWRLDPGGCRQNGWSAGASLAGSCSDAWAGAGAAAVQGWLPGTPGASTRHGRLLVAAGVPSQSAVTLAAGVPYTVCRVVLRTNATTTCAGCTIPACLVFNSLLIRRLPGSAFEEVLVTAPEVAGANVVVWQPAQGAADCASVPARSSTWGAVKALYR